MKDINFNVIRSNGSGKSGKFKIEKEKLYEIPATANVIYLRNGNCALGSATLTLTNRQIFRSKKGMFVRIPLRLPAVGKPGYISFEYKMSKSGYEYEWKWHHPATKRVINL